jgi:hypothetical protein
MCIVCGYYITYRYEILHTRRVAVMIIFHSTVYFVHIFIKLYL